MVGGVREEGSVGGVREEGSVGGVRKEGKGQRSEGDGRWATQREYEEREGD